ncbi:MAG: DUF3152 domain-containing protein [Pseudonocardiaceae bacterium]
MGSAPASSRSRPVAPHRPDSHRPSGSWNRLATRVADDQPLAASWDPQPEPTQPERTQRRADTAPGAGRHSGNRHGVGSPGWLARTLSTYGWRLYALPLLLVVTVLTLFDVAGSPPGSSKHTASAGFDDTPGSSEGDDARAPLIPNPLGAPKFEAVIESAVLPGGGPFTAQGAGAWRAVPGGGAAFGTGELFTYTVEVEDGVELEGGPAGFATTVDNTLNNPKSWIGSGHYQFRRTDDSQAADLRVSLTSQQTTRAMCGFKIPFDASCWKSDQQRVVINNARWARGAVAFQGNVVQYQQYVVNHEVGHGLGFSHTSCAVSGQLAPVMMQQTWGVANDYLAALGTDNVAPDGKVCEPNAWPFPTVP